MKKILAIALVLVLCLGVFAACTSTDEETTTAAEQSSETTLSGTLTLGGSTSVEAVISALMEQFMINNPDVTITYSPTGSSTGISGAADSSLDIGLSSRDLKEEELETLDQTVFALDGIAVVVNTANTITDISLEDLAKIATGEITNWSELGGDDVEIIFIGRDSASGTRDGFESIVDVSDICDYDEEQSSTGGVLASVQSNAGAIGYVSLASVSDAVVALTIDGIAATSETVLDGSYLIQRNFVFATLTDGTSELAQAFIEWATTDETAQTLIEAASAIPLA
ncbi:MAG: substrate-binding domain-containing protein [Clostridia bacterium]